ncbi:MAG: hypothetical protein N3E37_03460 [Candidatus Micrarchaeota archaeon]|nr:hypothetical protein [Candidatus Micrarchaeota archaeon]
MADNKINFNESELKTELEIRVKAFGVIKRIKFRISFIDLTSVPHKKTFFYETDNHVEVSELTRIANEHNLPFKARNAIAYPKGKKADDFIVMNQV